MTKLFIIHGWTYSIKPWTKTVELLSASGIEVVQLRVPGLTSPSLDVWTIDGYVTWLENELKGEKNPIVLGHSNGGRIAMHYLEKHPGAFKQLILLASAGVEVDSEKLSSKRKILRLASKGLSPLKHIPGAKKVVYRLLGSDYNAAPPNMKKTLANMLASDRTFDPSFITIPTNILWGKADRTTPLKMGEKLHRLIKPSTLEVHDTWAHAPYITHPDELATSLQQIIGIIK